MCVMLHTFLTSREILFLVKTADRISGLGQICCGWQGEELSIFSGNILYILQCYMSPFWELSTFLILSSLLMSTSFTRSFSVKGRLLSKAIFRQRLSSVKDRLPSEFVFHQRSFSIEGCLPSKVVFHRRLSSIKGRLPSKVVFHRRSSSIEGRLPSNVVFCPRGTPKVNQAKWAWSFRQ